MALEEKEREVGQLTFKEASVELEREDALERYTRGVELLRSLRDRLAHAEQRVQVMLDSTSEVEVPDTTTADATSNN